MCGPEDKEVKHNEGEIIVRQIDDTVEAGIKYGATTPHEGDISVVYDQNGNYTGTDVYHDDS